MTEKPRLQFSIWQLGTGVIIISLVLALVVIAKQKADQREEIEILRARNKVLKDEKENISKVIKNEMINLQKKLRLTYSALEQKSKQYENLEAYFLDSKGVHGKSARPLSRVLSGDTIEVNYLGELTVIRLFGIDAPEKGQRGYRESKDGLRRLLTTYEVVYLEFEQRVRDNDDHLLCNVFIQTPSGRVHLNTEMVRLGFANYSSEYGKSKYSEEFIRAEQEALKKASQ